MSFHLYYFVWMMNCDIFARPRGSHGVVRDLTVRPCHVRYVFL